MKVRCERCKVVTECAFHGEPADPASSKGQGGEWLCWPCAEARIVEMDNAIVKFRQVLGRIEDSGQRGV